MADHDWFRQTNWSSTIRDEFFAKLKRARKKSQYLRIQAYHLMKSDDPSTLQAALELLDTIIRDYPDSFDISPALLQRAECLASLGQTDNALVAFRRAIDGQRAFPNHRTGVAIKFGVFAFTHGREDLVEEIAKTLDELADRPLFPIQRYYHFGLLALIAARVGNFENAKKLATEALNAASLTDSGLRYHANLGLFDVKKVDRFFHHEIEKIAGKKSWLEGILSKPSKH